MREQLNQALTNLLAKNNDLPRLVILGVGNELNGDDAAGVLLVRKLKKLLPEHERILLIEASVAPENYTSIIRNYAPEWIWIFDAADLEIEPGGVQIIDISNIDSVGANTHRLSLSLLISYFQSEIGSETLILGIQPVTVDPFSNISLPVKQSIKQISRFLLDWLKNTYDI